MSAGTSEWLSHEARMDPAGAHRVREMSRGSGAETDGVPSPRLPGSAPSPTLSRGGQPVLSPRRPHPQPTRPREAASLDLCNWDLLFERRSIPFAVDDTAEEPGRVGGEAPSGLQSLTACSPLS